MQHVQKVDKMCFRLKFSHLPHRLFQGGLLLLEEVSFHGAIPSMNWMMQYYLFINLTIAFEFSLRVFSPLGLFICTLFNYIGKL